MSGSADAAAGTQSPVILLAEDDPATRRALASHLRRHGFQVLEAGRGDEAVQMLSDGTPVDLVVSDCNLPGGGANEITEAALRRSAPPKIILTSGYALEALVRRGAAPSGFPFLPKPFSPSALVSKVRAELTAPAEQTSSENTGA